MDLHTLLTVGFVVLAVGTAFVVARVGAVAIGVLPATPGVSDAAGTDEDVSNPEAEEDASATATGEDASATATGEDVSTIRDGADRLGGSRITAADYERIRNHLQKDRCHRRPDDLLPSDDDGS
jgi:hypothetical protein